MVTTVDRTKNNNKQNKQTTTTNQHPENQNNNQTVAKKLIIKNRYKTRLITTQVIEKILCYVFWGFLRCGGGGLGVRFQFGFFSVIYGFFLQR